VFILQYFVVWTLPDWLGILPGRSAPLVFIAELGLLWMCAKVWLAVGGNRWMTLGIGSGQTT
jgi:hypothetical protein